MEGEEGIRETSKYRGQGEGYKRKGVNTEKEERKLNVGGEVICHVY